LSGLAAAYSDIKRGIISNKLIIAGFSTGILLYIVLLLFDFLSPFFVISYESILWKMMDTVIAVLLGYFLWRLNFWSAGDGKLFGLYAFLMPLTFYSESYVDYFPSFNLLVNLFIPLLFVISIKTVLAGIRRRSEIKKVVASREFWSVVSFGLLKT